MINESILEDIGLTKSEIKVYVALLELGSSTTGKLVEKSKASSSKIYEILDKLIQKGLANFIIKSGIKYFEAAPPERIMDYMKKKEEKFQLQKQELKKILPDLELRHKLSKYKSEAVIYRGLEGLNTAFNSSLDLLKKGEEVLSMGIPKRSEAVNNFFIKHNIERARRGIISRIIFNISAKGEAQTFPKNSPLSKIKFSTEETPASINVFKDRTIIFPSEVEEPLLIVIDNKEIADSFRIQFENLWKKDIKIYEGREGLRQLFRDMLEFGDYLAFASGKEIIKALGEDFFIWFQEEKGKRGIKARGIMGEKDRESFTVHHSITKFKFIPGYDNPGATIIFKDKVANINFSKRPIAFLIENKEIADNNRTYFEALWNNDTSISKGWKAYEDAISDLISGLPPKGKYYVFNASYGSKQNEKKYLDFFKKIQSMRKERDVNVDLLFQQGTKEAIDKNMKNLYDERVKIKFLPYKTDSPFEILTNDKKTLLTIQGKEPTIISIENQDIAKAFNQNFEALWNQDVKVSRGLDAVQEVFEDVLNYKEFCMIGARGYFLDARPDYIKDWEKRAIEKGLKLRSIVDQDVKGHKVTTFPFAETKYTLPKEFTDLSVFWIYGEKVSIVNWTKKEPIILTIENRGLYDTYKKQFELLWEK